MSETRSVAVVGASNDRCKYGNKAVRTFRDCGWRVFPVNPNATTEERLKAYPSADTTPEYLDRVTVYVPAAKKPDQSRDKSGAEIVALGRSPRDYPEP